MYSPIPHDLTIYDDQFDFEENGFCPHQWEISVPQKNCILWGVVLSYLRSAVPDGFEERLNRLTENAFDAKIVKSSILDFNPFFNIHKCFFDETLQKVTQSFRKVLSEHRPPSAPKTVAHDIQLISTLLRSNILIVDLSNKNLHLVAPSEGCSPPLASITLFCRECVSKDSKKPVQMKRFTFSLNKDLCWELRRAALRIILETSEMSRLAEQEIEPLTEKEEKKVNILIAFLKKDLTYVISKLYDSPYTLAKLADAGFETDPRVLDADGFSAFYYALQSNDSILVYILFRYAANSCYESEHTFRDPNTSIISNLSKLKDILHRDCLISNNFEELGGRAEQARRTYQDLLIFSDFLTQVSLGIDINREKREGSSLELAVKLTERILLILDKYDTFFTVGNLPLISEKDIIENFTKHKTYYAFLDATALLLFFDNTFLLKGVLSSSKRDLYLELESNFLLSAITNKYFTGDAKNRIQLRDLDFDLDSRIISVIPLLERLTLREKVKKFRDIVREKKLVVEDLVQCIPKQGITERLKCSKDLEDEFLISRLECYMKAALSTTPKDMKQKLAIQRALLVIGESLNIEDTDPSSIRYLLRKCLPQETLEVLKKTRNTLSHFKSFQFPLKFETEDDDSLFSSIQSEIRNINKVFQKVFDIQRIRLMIFMINRGLESVQNFQADDGCMNTLVQHIENFRHELQIKTVVFEQMETNKNCVLVPNVKEFCRILMGCASKVTKEKILGEIPPEVKTRVDANKKLLENLEKGDLVDMVGFDTLFLNGKDTCSIKKEYEKYLQNESEADPDRISRISSLMHEIKNAPNPLNTLDLIFEKKKVTDSQLNFLHEIIPFSEKAKSTINTLLEFSQGPCGDHLANLLNRIVQFYRISIDERPIIRFLWEKAKSSKAKQYLVYKIVKHYLRDPSFKATIEMLFFDCVTILRNNDSFAPFWRKDSLLFRGIDLRNVIDDPYLVCAGDLLDPRDFPSEIVKKMLELFEDLGCIEALCDLWQKERRSSSEWYKSKERIVSCAHWQEYLHLLAEDPKDIELYKDVVSFLKNVSEPNTKKNHERKTSGKSYCQGPKVRHQIASVQK